MKVRTSDGAVFEIDAKIVKLSGFLTDIAGKQGDKRNDEPVPLPPKITSPVMKKVIEWAEHHKDDPLTNKEGGENDGITAWDSQFIRVDQKMLCQVILAATHLKIDRLMDLVCKSA